MTHEKSRRSAGRPATARVADDEIPLSDPVYSRSAAGLRPLEELCLDLIRLFCADTVDAGKGSRNDAYALSLQRLGAQFGMEYANRVLCLVKAIRTERGGPFRFLHAGCCSVSTDELSALGAIRAARHAGSRNGSTALDTAIQDLSAGRDGSRIVFAVRTVAEAQKQIEIVNTGPAAMANHSASPASMTLH